MTTLATARSNRYNARLGARMTRAFEKRDAALAMRILSEASTATDENNALVAAREAGFQYGYEDQVLRIYVAV